MSCRRRSTSARDEVAQATVETALVLPVVVVVALIVVQAGLLARDQVLAVGAARIAARAVTVEPTADAARRALGAAGLADRVAVEVRGATRPGGLATVTVELEAATVPVVGRALAGRRLRERLTVLVEGG